MAKVTTQTIPSEDRLNYKRACQIATTAFGVAYVRKRFPWHMPKMQKGGYGVTPGQQAQRDKFITVKELYATLSAADKQRWVDSNPEWNSYLYGYNFFMLEGLSGGGPLERPQMIKSIQVVKEEVPTTGTKSFTIATVDPAKTVVMIQGNSFISDTVQRFSGVAEDNSEVEKTLDPEVDPDITEVRVYGTAGYQELVEGTGSGKWASWYCSSLAAALVKIKLDNIDSAGTHGYFIEVIEHKAQTIYPVLVSVAAEAVVIDWAQVPSVPAEVSITVVEYL